MIGDEDDLLDRFVPKNLLDLVPEVIPASQSANVDPSLVAGTGQASSQPPREPIILGIRMGDEDGLARQHALRRWSDRVSLE